MLEQGYEIREAEDLSEETLCRQVVGCDAILARTAKISRRVLEAGTRLKIVARHGVGVDNIDLEAATELGIQVTNTPLANVETVAEHTIGLILALSHGIVLQDGELRRGNFQIRDRQPGIDVAGKALGLLGLGNIGLLVARKAALGLDMKVLAFVRTPRPVPEWIELVEDREALFRRADFLSLHVPATTETYHAVGRRELEWMKPTAYLVNTARGDVVDEAALIEALENGLIAGAALDTFEQEPPDPANPLFRLSNVVVTPHSAALTVEAMDRMAIQAGQEIQRVLNGEEPKWAVNRKTFLAKADECARSGS